MLAAYTVLVEDRLTTAAFAYPLRAGWLAAPGVVPRPHVSAADSAAAPLALVDSVEARSLLRSHVIVREVAVAARRATMLTLATSTRPDEVGHVTASLAGVSQAGRAVAVIVIPEFYGISVVNWTQQALAPSDATIVVQEDAAALIAIDDEESYQEDLGRAWFLLTDLPFVSHVCLARRDMLTTDPEGLAAALGHLHAARDLSRSRGRELRRDLSKDLGVEREVLADALADQTLYLGTEEQQGLEELWKRTGLPLSAAEARGAFVSVRTRHSSSS